MANVAEKSLTIEPATWCAQTDHLIGQALQHATPAEIRHQVEHCGARLFHIKHGAAIVGAFVLRVDGNEGVIVAATAKLDGIDMVGACMPAIEAMFIGCNSIRYHTARPALVRKMARLGYVAREIVCFKELNKNDQLLAA